MDWLEERYVGMLSRSLQRFTKKSSGKYNFRCPICGDSEKNKYKARGWIYQVQGKSRFHCFNCSSSMSVPKFIKTIDQSLYNEFMLEKLRENKTPEQIELETFVNKMKAPEFTKTVLKGLKKVSQLSPDHPIKKYVDGRKIPPNYHYKLYVCPNFFRFCNEHIPGKFSEKALQRDETRLLIPFITADKKIHAFQGRALGKSNVKYITIVLDESVPKIYGLDTTDFSKKTYVVEGPIDAMFIDNCIATAGGDLVSALQGIDKSKLVIVYDNEPRSKDTINKIYKAILYGYNVCIWPDNLEHKDINDMIMNDMSSDYIKHIIDTNTYSDLQAKLRLQTWSKI